MKSEKNSCLLKFHSSMILPCHSYTGMTLYIAKVVPLSRLANIKKLVMESNQ